MRIRLRIAYDGTEYSGFQCQVNGVAIQDVVNRALSDLFRIPVRTIGASRTDAGVHAEGNVAVFDIETRIHPSKIAFALNARLPEDIRITESEQVPDDWHPRYRNTVKTYEYRIMNRIHPDPLTRRTELHYYYKLNDEDMNRAAGMIVGEHDFASFCAAGSTSASTVRTIYDAHVRRNGDRVVFSKDESDRLDCDAVILDECSMVDILLMDALLRALPPDARLIMVGDADQLPSVGPGNVFSALIRSKVVATVRLTEIFRQNEGSRIIRNAHMINRGEHPDFAENAGDFFRLKRLQAGTSVETITELCTVRLPNKMHIPCEEIQVLSPTRKGETGTVALNRRLQQAINPPAPGKKEKPFGDVIFREGDRVMQIRNNYDVLWHNADNTEAGTGIYNGDIGTLLSIDPDSETLTIDFDGRIASYGFDALIELEHAWAITVHKAQGSEYRAVILALGSSSQMLMTRGVLYTAVTRAKELLILVGDENQAHQMIDNVRQSRRYTALRVRLRKLCGVE